MKIQKALVFNQKSQEVLQIAQKFQTTEGVCGFVTCAVIRYISQHGFDPKNIKLLNQQTLTPIFQDVIKAVLNQRRQQIKKFKIMATSLGLNYLKNEVANYQISDYLENAIQKMQNKQIYFFRQTYSNNPQIIKELEYEQAARIEEQQTFKGEMYFFSSFQPYKNHFVEQFVQELTTCDLSKPVIIATDTLGHFYTTVLFEGEVFILDSLDAYMDNPFDSKIVECIANLYKQALVLKKQVKQQ